MHNVIIQGGMGIGVSGWRLAGAVARHGGLGVVSGVALDTLIARRLQDGDPGGHVRRALEQFPVPEISARVLTRYYRESGRRDTEPYRPIARLDLQPSPARQQLAILAAFVEVTLAKQAADGGRVGLNLLEKIQLATPAAAYGAMLAGVDVVLVGAGIPARLPALLDALARHRPMAFPIDVVSSGDVRHALDFDPVALLGRRLPELRRPQFLAIVSSATLASFLSREDLTRPDGFVVEGAIAGGHNAPPRGALRLDAFGEPVYGPKDELDPTTFAALGLPFWLAGGYARPERLAAARACGASGVQVGSVFALARESGIAPALRQRLLGALRRGELAVRTDANASPTGFPFKVALLDGTLADPDTYTARRRVCDLSYLRTPYRRADGTIGYRCAAEPVDAYVRKGGSASDTAGRVCLCNALTATIGLGQRRHDGTTEAPLSTLGADLAGARELLARHPEGWGAADVIDYLTHS